MQLHRRRDEIEAKGARIVVVGNGQPSFIEGFREKSGFDGEIYTDPTLETYRALKLRRSKRSSMCLKSIRKAFRAYRQGFRQDNVRGDPWQQGGVFVVKSGGDVSFSYPSEHAGDHPPVRALIAALD